MFHILLKTSRSVSIELDNTSIYHAPKPYDVYLNGIKVKEGVATNVTSLFDLTQGTTYAIEIDGFVMEVTTDHESGSVDVRDFGAKGDGIHDDTMAIQSAMLSCPKEGVVVIPEGIYHIKPIFLKSKQTIELKKGAILLGNTDRNQYPILPARMKRQDGTHLELSSWEGVPQPTYASLITGILTDDVNIIGEGIIDENAQNGDWWIQHKVMRGAWRPKGVFLSNCTNIRMQGVTVKNTPSWNLHPYFSSHIDFIDMKLISPKDSPNTDGCNPESCNHVRVIGVDFSVGDDCIAIKSGKFEMGMTYRKPTENMTVRNCMMAYGHGAVVLGSEMSGGIRNLSVSQCYFKETDRGLRIKTRRGRGESGIIDGITFENIYMKDVLTPLVMNMYYYCDDDGKTEYVYSKQKLPIDERTPYLGKFTFRNMVCEDVHVAAGFFYGLPEQPIASIELENITFTYAEQPIEGIPAMMSFLEPMKGEGLHFHYVNQVKLKDVTLKRNKEDSILLDHVLKYNDETSEQN